MALLLNTSYSDKEEAKRLGAKWNPDLKKWYCKSNDKDDYFDFIDLVLKDKDEAYVLCDHLYIVIGEHICFRCNTATNVIGFGIENYCTFLNTDVYDEYIDFYYYSDEIHIAHGFEPISDDLLNYLNKKFNFHLGYSKTINNYYFANHCQNCGIIQGDWFIFNEVNSPFFVDSVKKARNLKLIKITLKYDFVFSASIGFGSMDYLIKKHAKVIDTITFKGLGLQLP